jgi:hypothetical protein
MFIETMTAGTGATPAGSNGGIDWFVSINMGYRWYPEFFLIVFFYPFRNSPVYHGLHPRLLLLNHSVVLKRPVSVVRPDSVKLFTPWTTEVVLVP